MFMKALARSKSHWYWTVGMFNDGIIPYFAQDVSFKLDQLASLNQTDPNGILTGKLDLQRVGTFGISLGGIVGSEACRLDPRLQACLVMDAPIPVDVVQDSLQQPTMLSPEMPKLCSSRVGRRQMLTRPRLLCGQCLRRASLEKVISCKCPECSTSTLLTYHTGPQSSPGWALPGR